MKNKLLLTIIAMLIMITSSFEVKSNTTNKFNLREYCELQVQKRLNEREDPLYQLREFYECVGQIIMSSKEHGISEEEASTKLRSSLLSCLEEKKSIIKEEAVKYLDKTGAYGMCN